MNDPNAPPTAPERKGNGSRYLFLLLLGLVVGVVATVMLLRALDARKTWEDRYPSAAMHVMNAHMQQLAASVEQNRCAPTDSLPHLQSLRMLANDLDPAFPGLRDDKRFADHSSNLRAALDGTLASPPLNCEGVRAAMKDLGESCKACHQDFRG